jgi:hypothetical protein
VQSYRHFPRPRPLEFPLRTSHTLGGRRAAGGQRALGAALSGGPVDQQLAKEREVGGRGRNDKDVAIDSDQQQGCRVQGCKGKGAGALYTLVLVTTPPLKASTMPRSRSSQ